jgi:hypothetical protein
MSFEFLVLSSRAVLYYFDTLHVESVREANSTNSKLKTQHSKLILQG